jgi:hypothetical protein
MPESTPRVIDAIRRLHADAGLSWPAVASGPPRPVPLDRLITACRLVHEEVSELSRATAGACLARRGVRRQELLDDPTPLAGLVFADGRGGCILVRAEDSLPRRRFTAAHELGHYLLHFLPELSQTGVRNRELLQIDQPDSVREEERVSGDEPALPERERQANRFAVELLLPEAVCRAVCEQYTGQLHPSTRFLEHQLASGLLVSRETARWRLRELGLTGGGQRS